MVLAHLHQVTIWATLTPTTARTLAAIIQRQRPHRNNPATDVTTGTSQPEFSDPLPAPYDQKSSVIMKARTSHSLMSRNQSRRRHLDERRYPLLRSTRKARLRED